LIFSQPLTVARPTFALSHNTLKIPLANLIKQINAPFFDVLSANHFRQSTFANQRPQLLFSPLKKSVLSGRRFGNVDPSISRRL
jgi:hypothetical protein